jgi:hypothetical protein
MFKIAFEQAHRNQVDRKILKHLLKEPDFDQIFKAVPLTPIVNVEK